MKQRLFTTALLAAVLCFLAMPAAQADNIVTNQWYTAAFGAAGTEPSPIFGPPYIDGVNGPVLPSGFAAAINAPTGTDWTITLAGSGTLTVTDVEVAGDQFQMFDNGVAMSLAPSPFTAAGQNPGQPGLANGYTSADCNACDSTASEDINFALGDVHYSSGTFLLSAGLNDITGTWVGVIGGGDVNFIAEPSVVPEPYSLALLGTVLVGLAVRRKLA